MNIKTCLLVAVFDLMFSLCQAQTKKLSAPEFQNEIVNQWWTYENKEIKKDCDMRIFVIKDSEFELNCVNWADGFSGNKCNYELSFTDNFFELRPKSCKNNESPGFLYGYLSETNQLLLLISKKQLALSPVLLSDKRWLRFDRVKR